MKFNLYHSSLNGLSADRLIADLRNRDRSKKHIIITTDKSSLYYERKLFQILQESSFFDISVTTLSRFANSVIGAGHNILTKQGGVLIVKRILLEHKSELKSFSKSCELIGFAGSLFDTICMFKSCNIAPSQIEEVSADTLNNKLQDIKFVYEKYEEYLKNQYTDSFNRLNLCAMKISKDDFSDVDFYFVGFDDFTKQGYAIIEKLLKCSSSVSIATTYAKTTDEKKNGNIYLNNVYYNAIDIAKLVGVECNKIEVKGGLGEDKLLLSNCVLANRIPQLKDNQDYLNIIKYNNIDDEIKNTILDIKFQIVNNNLRYKNFAVVVSDMGRYKTKLTEYCNKLNVNYFLDEKIKLKDTLFSRFVSNLISILHKPTKFNVLAFLKSALLDINVQDIDNYSTFVDKYEPQFDNLLKSENENIQKYFDILTKYRHSNAVRNVLEILDSIAYILSELGIENRVENLLKEYYSRGDLEEYRVLKQSYGKVLTIFDEVKVIDGYECSYLELSKFFDMYVDNLSIVVPPIVTDAVTIASTDCENLFDVDYVYFLGFNEGVAPRYNVDSGIISDDEIEKMPLRTRLNPTISVINKRLKFKLFELIFVANKKAIVSYPTKGADGDMYPNAIINSLVMAYGVDVIKNGSTKLDIVNNSVVHFDEDNFIYNNFSKDVATDNYVQLMKCWDNYSDNKNYILTMSTLHNIVGDGSYVENLKYDNNLTPITRGVFLQSQKIGISEIERFNTCPYAHFVDYGLKLKPCEKNDLSALDIGNIIHEFVKIAIFRLDENDIAQEILDKILEKDDYKYLVENKNNNFVIKSLKEEAERIFKVLKYQQSVSSFSTKSAELPFNMKLCSIDGKDICLTGVIDRVDEFEKGIRVIDYKTGNISFKNFDDIYYGNKVQVIVYLSALSKDKNLDPLGALYFPISNAFAVDKCEDLYQMQGVVEKSLTNMLAFDKNLSEPNYSSNIVNLSTTAKGEIYSNSYYKNMCLSNADILKVSEFVMDLVKESINKIDCGEINPHPLDDTACRYCEYKGLCNFNEKYNNAFRRTIRVRSIEELLGGQDE